MSEQLENPETPVSNEQQPIEIIEEQEPDAETPEPKAETAEAPETEDVKYSPTTIVLAKVKGFPPWPAMILKEDLLPENIIQKKPKSIRSKPTGKKKKPAAPARILPVRFFSDDTYIWINSNDVKLLEKSQIDKYIEANLGKRKKESLLDGAYKLAADPPEMELFVLYGSKAAPEEIEEVEEIIEDEEDEEEEDEEDEEDEEEEEDEDEPPKKKSKTTKSARPSRAKATKTSKTSKAKASKAKAKPKAPPKVSKADERKLAQQKKKEAERKLLAEYDSDWGLDELNEYDVEGGNYIFDTEKEQQTVFQQEVPSAAEIQEQLAQAQATFSDISDDLVGTLLEQNEINEKRILKKLAELETIIEEVPKTVVSKSRLLRVMILTVRKTEVANEKIRNEISRILESVLEISVRRNLEEEVTEPEVIDTNGQLKSEEGVEVTEVANGSQGSNGNEVKHEPNGSEETNTEISNHNGTPIVNGSS